MSDLTIVRNVGEAEPGEYLERQRTHSLLRRSNGLMLGVFCNERLEDAYYKVTLTALTPNAPFLLFQEGRNECERLFANRAGILEVRFGVPALSKCCLEEVEHVPHHEESESC